MPQDQSQPQGQMNENEIAAVLGYMTTLNQHVNGQHPDQIASQQAAQPQEAPPSPETAPQQPQAPETPPTPDPRVDDLESQFKDLKKEVEGKIKEEIGQVRDMVEKALTEEDAKE